MRIIENDTERHYSVSPSVTLVINYRSLAFQIKSKCFAARDISRIKEMNFLVINVVKTDNNYWIFYTFSKG